MTIVDGWTIDTEQPDFIAAIPADIHRQQLQAEREALIIKGYEMQRARDVLQLAGDDYTEQVTVATTNLRTVASTIKALDTLIERLDTPTE